MFFTAGPQRASNSLSSSGSEVERGINGCENEVFYLMLLIYENKAAFSLKRIKLLSVGRKGAHTEHGVVVIYSMAFHCTLKNMALDAPSYSLPILLLIYYIFFLTQPSTWFSEEPSFWDLLWFLWIPTTKMLVFRLNPRAFTCQLLVSQSKSFSWSHFLIRCSIISLS